MNINNHKQAIIYIIVSGFVFFILHATLDAIFITTLPLEKGEVSYESFETGPDGEMTIYATGFADEYAEEKYYYNESIKDRKPYLMAVVGAIALLVNWLLFIVIPKKTVKDNEGKWGELIILSFLTAIVAPVVYSFILPAPELWFPSFITDISDNIIQAELYKIYNN